MIEISSSFTFQSDNALLSKRNDDSLSKNYDWAVSHFKRI